MFKDKEIEKIIKKKDINACLKEIGKYKEWATYESGILNYINSLRTSMTAPKRIGQLSELISEYSKDFEQKTEEKNPISFKNWYFNKENVFESNGKSIKPLDMNKLGTNQTDGKSIFENVIKKNIESKNVMIEKLKSITDKDIEIYISELMFEKTFFGLLIEEPVAIQAFKILINENGGKFNKNSYRKSNSYEESKGIDYIYEDHNNKILIQIKPARSEWYRKLRSGIPEINDECFLVNYESDKNDKEIIKLKIIRPKVIL